MLRDLVVETEVWSIVVTIVQTAEIAVVYAVNIIPKEKVDLGNLNFLARYSLEKI